MLVESATAVKVCASLFLCKQAEFPHEETQQQQQQHQQAATHTHRQTHRQDSPVPINNCETKNERS